LSRGSARAYREARREGHEVTGLLGDLTQLGGTLVTDPPRIGGLIAGKKRGSAEAGRRANEEAPWVT
jgi:hypothetical protein